MYMYIYLFMYVICPLQSGKVIVLESNTTTYEVVNKKLIKSSKFKIVFTVQYMGSEDDVPSGTCSDLELLTSKYQSCQQYYFENKLYGCYFGLPYLF